MREKTSHGFDMTRLKFIGLGLCTGVFAGIIVSLFRLGIEKISAHLPQWFTFLKHHLIYLPIAIIIVLLLTVINGFLIRKDPNIKGSGIPQVEGQLRGQLSLNWWSVLSKKFVGGLLSISSGLFLGREGPSIQLGASVGQGMGEMLHLNVAERKIMISSGAAAGLSAAFNAPIAAVLFILEEVHHNFSPLVWLTSFASALASNFISLNIFGLTPVLYLGPLKSLPLKHYGALLIMGIFLGILALFYQQVLLSLEKWYSKLPLKKEFYSLVPFLLLIPVGIFFPNELGGGNQVIHQLGNEKLFFWTLLGLFALRFIFSMISYGSGLPGGIFLPILTLGAILGGIFGVLWCQITGLDQVYIANFIICAMAGYFAAIGKAPLTALILITEMVGTVQHLMPLGVVCLAAYVTLDLLGGRPIYEALLERMVAPDFGTFHGKKTTIEFPVIAESHFSGRMIRDFVWPKEMLLTSIIRGEEEILTRGDTVMRTGDVLVILTDTGLAQQIKFKLEELEKTNPEDLAL